jgi:hypothetical protein
MVMNNSNMFFYQYLSSQQPCKHADVNVGPKRAPFGAEAAIKLSL